MADITIPDAAVEAAARADYYNVAAGLDDAAEAWETYHDREWWLNNSRIALAAAAPHIAAQALRDAASAFYGPDGPRGEVGPAVWLRARADRIEDPNG